jgi:hypothetical protein
MIALGTTGLMLRIPTRRERQHAVASACDQDQLTTTSRTEGTLSNQDASGYPGKRRSMFVVSNLELTCTETLVFGTETPVDSFRMFVPDSRMPAPPLS